MNRRDLVKGLAAFVASLALPWRKPVDRIRGRYQHLIAIDDSAFAGPVTITLPLELEPDPATKYSIPGSNFGATAHIFVDNTGHGFQVEPGGAALKYEPEMIVRISKRREATGKVTMLMTVDKLAGELPRQHYATTAQPEIIRFERLKWKDA